MRPLQRELANRALSGTRCTDADRVLTCCVARCGFAGAGGSGGSGMLFARAAASRTDVVFGFVVRVLSALFCCRLAVAWRLSRDAVSIVRLRLRCVAFIRSVAVRCRLRCAVVAVALRLRCVRFGIWLGLRCAAVAVILLRLWSFGGGGGVLRLWSFGCAAVCWLRSFGCALV